VLIVAGLTALSLASSFTGCRAVIGVEDLHVADDASTEGGATDGNAGDAGATIDASDALVRSDVDLIIEGCSNGDCRKCCKQAFPQQNSRLEDRARTSQCICAGAGTCVSECGGTACASPPQPPDPTCAPCLDGRLTSTTGVCKTMRDDCKADPSCAPVATCLEACH
jgi:hypothetical protein